MSLKTRLTKLGAELRSAGEAASKLALGRSASVLAEPSAEPPVVARLIVEVRSDGSHTIARGALEAGGEAVSIEAHGSTPAQLAASLVRTIFSAPALLQQVARSARGGERELQRSRTDDPDPDAPR